jgi:glycosyltransferase involved in cell wall biosynthesis
MARSGPLRVAVVARAVAPLHGVGGLERSVRDLVRHLAVSDVDVTLITPPPAGGPLDGQPVAHADSLTSPRIHLKHVRYVTFPFANRRGTTILDRSTSYLAFGVRAGRLAGELAARHEVDIVHGFGASVLGYAQRRATYAAPLVFNPQGLEEFGATLDTQPFGKRVGYGPLRWAVRRCARAADAVIATDKSLEPTVQRHLQLAPGQMRTIPNGIDLDVVSALATAADGAAMRARHGIGADEFVLLSVGRIEANKGFDVLAQALQRASFSSSGSGRALAQIPWRWIVVGSGPFQGELERVIDAAGIRPRVVLAGRATDEALHAWYEAASIFAHPTRYEGSSLVTLEAMAHGRAVIATRAGGLPDKVTPGLNGWLVNPDDVEALAHSLDEAATARARLPEMGARSREIVARDFSWARLVQTQIALYNELLSAG